MVEVKKGDRFDLQCGHDGRVVWISADGKAFAVRGSRRGCRNCGKGSSSEWTATVHLFYKEEKK